MQTTGIAGSVEEGERFRRVANEIAGRDIIEYDIDERPAIQPHPRADRDAGRGGIDREHQRRAGFVAGGDDQRLGDIAVDDGDLPVP